jgi:hypothetical protein
MAATLRHPLTRADYYAESGARVRVVDGDKWGRFDRTGAWLEGELRQCDPQMCRWLAGVLLMHEQAQKAGQSPEDKA